MDTIDDVRSNVRVGALVAHRHLRNVEVLTLVVLNSKAVIAFHRVVEGRFGLLSTVLLEKIDISNGMDHAQVVVLQVLAHFS